MNLRIKLAGAGGQGIQFAAKLIGEAAFKQGLNISQGTLYEPATSGGLTLADITIAPKGQEIIYPFIEHPDILVVLSQHAWDLYSPMVSSGTIVLADKDNVQNFNDKIEKKAKYAFHLPFSEKAREIGSDNVTNVVVTGFLAEMLDIDHNHVSVMLRDSHPFDAEEYELLEVSPEKFEDSLIEDSPAKFKEMNIQAFHTGYNMSKDLDYEKFSINANSN